MERKLSKIYTPYAILFFTFVIPLISALSADENEIKAPSYQIKVVDGDSLEINSKRIRLTGIDAPEYMQSCKTDKNKKYNCGNKSKEFLKELIKDKTITCISHSKDQYDRDLCTCYANNIDINKELVRTGHAIAYLESNYYKDQEYAKQNKLGIWQGDFIHPRLFRRLKNQ
jgi:endonuclease YncB( thermonuclease family)